MRRASKELRKAGDAARLALSLLLVLPGLVLAPLNSARATTGGTTVAAKSTAKPPASAPAAPQQGQTVYPTEQPAATFSQVNVREAARQEALAPQQAATDEIKAIDPPKARPESFENRGVPRGDGGEDSISFDMADQPSPETPAPSAQGSSPGPNKTFQGEFLSGSSIPPDTMGAVGTSHVVSVSNNQMNIRTREGVLLVRMTLNAFWAGVVLEGGITTPSTFDPKIYYDRFNDKYFFFTSANSVSPASSVLFAVTATNDPTGTWNRYVFDADPTATATAGRWADYPTIGFNKNWIVANYNVFNYSGAATTGYYGPYVYVIDKGDAYNGGTLAANLFQANSATQCVLVTDLGCGFTMAPATVEDNTTETEYLVEDWDATAAQLRVSKITGTASSPVLTVGTQFPQSPFSWRFNAARIATTGGYLPERDQVAYAPSTTTRVMANDSRINNSVLRNGTLWASHHVMVGATPTPAGTGFSTTNPDIRTAVQWWQIDPTIENSMVSTVPLQRARIEDPVADNCNSGNSTNVSTARAGCTQVGQFFAFAGISVNKDNDVLIGFSQFSPLTYPSAAYALRRAADPPNTMRDVVVYRSGASNYNIGGGTAGTTARQNRWGDYSASQTDPVNDTDFWTVQEYSGTRTDFGIGIAAPWATWWAQVKPASTQPTTTGNLIISEFRLRGPSGINDEFVELYNPSSTTPHRVASVDNSDGWALATNNGTTTTPLTVVPQGVVVPPLGHYLIANSPVSNAAGAETLYYSLRAYPGSPARTADADTGYSSTTATVDAIADNTGVALFKSSTAAAFLPANQADAAGFAGAGTTFREGTGIPAITGAPTGQISFHRIQSSGTPQDTNNNATDFQFIDTVIETLGVQPTLGAPGPENVDAPRLNNNVFVDRFDVNVSQTAPPNRVRRLCSDPMVEECNPNRSALGTLSSRRMVTNLTGLPVTRIRFRIRQITTFPPPPGVADLRGLTSGNIIVTRPTGEMVTVLGTTLEEPPTQALGGGWNASWTVTLASPLMPGQSFNVQYLFGVQQGGSFSVFINTEALTQ